MGGWQYLVLNFDLLTLISIGIICSSKTIHLPRFKILSKVLLSNCWVIICTMCVRLTRSDIELWPTDLNINRDYLLIKDYLPTNLKFLWQSIFDLYFAVYVRIKTFRWERTCILRSCAAEKQRFIELCTTLQFPRDLWKITERRWRDIYV